MASCGQLALRRSREHVRAVRCERPASQLESDRRGVRRHHGMLSGRTPPATAMPVVWSAALTAAVRWGRVGGGFAGGKAAGQAFRASDRACNLIAAAAGGLAAAEAVGSIPMSVATFVAFSAVFEGFAPKAVLEGVLPKDAAGRTEDAPARGDPQAEAIAKAKADYARRHKDNPVRMRALKS